jgi:hypothetical protein
MTATPRPVFMAQMNQNIFTAEFLGWLPLNLRVYAAFEREATRVATRGYRHYSARTIIEVLRHHSALEEEGGAWKLNDWHTPYLARLYALLNPDRIGLFEFRYTKAARQVEGSTA